MILKQLLQGLTIGILLLSTINATSQSEVTIEDIGSDKLVTIELETDDSVPANHRHMQTGINNGEGYLKTVSDNDLSFWTNSSRKMTIENNGFVGIGTSNPQDMLHVRTGRLRIEANSFTSGTIFNPTTIVFPASLDFDFSNSKMGGVAYSPLSVTPFSPEQIVFKNNLEGVINLSTDDKPRVIIKEDGGIRLPGLAQGVPANVFVDNFGNLKTKSVDKVYNITPTKLRYDYPLEEINPHLARGQFDIFQPVFASINIPNGSVITKATIFYVDDSSQRNLIISFEKGKHNSGSSSLYSSTPVFTSTGSPSSSTTDIEVESINLNYTVANSDAERTNISILLPSVRLGISSIVLEYN